MPQLYNGCGTWYYGKENVHLEWGACEHCRRVTTLLSYDTQRYIVGLGVPLIPFGRYRVLRQCGACTKHKAAKLPVWEKAKAEAREKALQMVQNPPDSRDAVDETVGGVLAFHDVDTFNEIVPFLVERYPNDPDMVGLIGSGYHFFGRLEEASNALRASLNAKEDVATRRELCLVLIRLRRAEEAHEVLRPLLAAGQPENLWHWFLLAAAYQANGNHRAALDLVSEANRLYPETASEKEWKAFRKTSEKHLDSGKPVVPKILQTDTQQVRESNAPIARFAGPVVVLALVIGFAVWSYYTSQHHKLFLVNGLDRAYDVQWDGETYKLARKGVLPLETDEGQHTVAAPDIGLDAEKITIDANAFSRPFASPIFVVNPDRVAPIIREMLEYVDESDASEEADYEYDLFVGLFHKINKVNYTFEPFPQSVMGEEGSKTTRTRVGLAQDWSPMDVYRALAIKGRAEEAKDYLLRRFEHQPDEVDALALLGSVLQADEYLGVLRGKLGARPVHVEVHRTYQEFMERSHPDHDLVEEYAAYLAAEPGDASLKYLLARARPVPDDETLRLFREACEAQPPCPYAYHALATYHLSEGRAAEALELADRACELQPGKPDFKANRRLALIASRSWEGLLKDVEREPAGPDASVVELSVETMALAALGKPMEEIEQQINRTVAGWRRAGLDEQYASALVAVLKADAAYVQGDLEGFGKYAADAGQGLESFAAALTSGDLEKALGAISADEDPSPRDFLLVYLLADMKNDAARAEEYLGKWIEMSREGTPFQRHIAACLSGEKPCVPDEISVYGQPLEDMAALFTVLGVKFPEHCDAFFARARVLNFNPQFPNRFLAGILGSATEASAPVSQ